MPADREGASATGKSVQGGRREGGAGKRGTEGENGAWRMPDGSQEGAVLMAVVTPIPIYLPSLNLPFWILSDLCQLYSVSRASKAAKIYCRTREAMFLYPWDAVHTPLAWLHCHVRSKNQVASFKSSLKTKDVLKMVESNFL